MKKFIKNIVPPIIYVHLRKLLHKPRVFNPRWNTLTYKPLAGIKIFFDPTGPWQKRIIDNTYDAFLFERFKSEKMDGKVVFDIGAHIGFHSLYFARLVGPKGKVYAFEPNPANIERIKLNLEENPDVKNIIKIVDAAVSDVSGTEEFSMSTEVESGVSSGSFIDTADTIWERDTYKLRGFKEIQVTTVPIDLLRDKMGIPEAPDVLKIDVEGAESLVLLGAKKTLLAKKPLILMEVHSMLNMFNVVTLLTSLSYEMQIISVESDGRCFIEARPKAEQETISHVT